MQPTGERGPIPDRSRPAKQDQERGLEGIVGVIRVVEHAPTDAQHHGAVPFDQRLEGRLDGINGPGRDSVQQLSVRKSPDDAHVPERP